MPVNAAAKVFKKSPGVKILACFHAQNGIGPFWPEGYARGNERPGFQQGEAPCEACRRKCWPGASRRDPWPRLSCSDPCRVQNGRMLSEIRPNLREVLRIVAGAKDSRFQKKHYGFRGDLGIRAAHDAGQADRAIGIANAQIRALLKFAILPSRVTSLPQLWRGAR